MNTLGSTIFGNGTSTFPSTAHVDLSASRIIDVLTSIPLEYSNSPDGTRWKVGNIVYEKRTNPKNGQVESIAIGNVGNSGGMATTTDNSSVVSQASGFGFAIIAIILLISMWK